MKYSIILSDQENGFSVTIQLDVSHLIQYASSMNRTAYISTCYSTSPISKF